MKNTNRQLWLSALLLVLAFSFFACKKDEVKSATDLITGGSSKAWKLSSLKVSGTAVTPVPDLVITVNTNGTYSTSGFSPENGEWKLSNSDKTFSTRTKLADNSYDAWTDSQITSLSETLFTSEETDSTGVKTEITLIPN